MARPLDYALDRSGGSTLAVCLHCDARAIRADPRSATEAICRHLRDAHRADAGIQRRLRGR